MPDLTNLTGVTGAELTDAQLYGILNQLDLDILNLARDGKLATVNYGTGKAAGGTGRFTTRSEAMRSLVEARRHYESLLERRRQLAQEAPAIAESVARDCDCP